MTHTLPSGSFISINIDEDFNEFIIENIKSMVKGDGSILAQWAIALWNAEYSNMDCTLYAYPQDATIDQEGLVAFWTKQGFEIDHENNAGDGTAMKY